MKSLDYKDKEKVMIEYHLLMRMYKIKCFREINATFHLQMQKVIAFSKSGRRVQYKQ